MHGPRSILSHPIRRTSVFENPSVASYGALESGLKFSVPRMVEGWIWIWIWIWICGSLSYAVDVSMY